MGIGEPFDNFNEMLAFLKIINHDKGLNIGARHITVSTSGIIPKIYDFADQKCRSISRFLCMLRIRKLEAV